MIKKEYIAPCLILMEIEMTTLLAGSGVISDELDFGGIDEEGVLEPSAPDMQDVITPLGLI